MNLQRIIFFATLLHFFLSVYGQEPQITEISGKFEVGEYISMDDQENLTIYFNCSGKIEKKSCALFYRKGKMDSTNVSLAGRVKDYYITDTLAFEGHIEKGLLHGLATYYHENGKIKSRGNYSQNIRTGKWSYYYDNGNYYKTINFVQGYPSVTNLFKRNGKQLIKQGNGKYNGHFRYSRSCSPYRISGKVHEGKMHGKWKLYAENYQGKVATEFYDNGKFIKRTSSFGTYTGQPIIHIDGFHPNEYLLWTESTAGCPGTINQPLKFKNRHLNQLFYPAVEDSLKKLLSDSINNQWLIAGIQIHPNSIAHSVKIKSSIGDSATESKIYRLLKSMIYFSPAIYDGLATETNHCFTIIFYENSVYLPPLIYYNELQKTLPDFTQKATDP